MTYYEKYQKQSRGKWATRTRYNPRLLPLYQLLEGHIFKLERNFSIEVRQLGKSIGKKLTKTKEQYLRKYKIY